MIFREGDHNHRCARGYFVSNNGTPEKGITSCIILFHDLGCRRGFFGKLTVSKTIIIGSNPITHSERNGCKPLHQSQS